MPFAIPSSGYSLLTALAVCGLLSGCSPKVPEAASDAPLVLARVGEAEITAKDFEWHLKSRRERSQPPVDPKVLLEELVQREILVQHALKAGLQDDPEIREKVRDVWIAHFKERELTTKLNEVKISEDELKTAYEKEKDSLIKPERVRIAMLFVSSPSDAAPEAGDEIRRRLEAAAQSSVQDADSSRQGFGAFAVNLSEDQESRYRGGEIGWVERDRYPQRLDPVVIETGFALKEPGSTSAVVKGRQGFYVVKLLERQAAAVPPLDQVEPALRRRLTESRQDRLQSEFESSLRSGLTVEVHPERLSSLPKTSAPEAPPSLPSLP
jgi:hypothetical protein